MITLELSPARFTTLLLLASCLTTIGVPASFWFNKIVVLEHADGGVGMLVHIHMLMQHELTCFALPDQRQKREP